MRISNKTILLGLVATVIVIFAVVIWQSSGGEKLAFGNFKNTCDGKFLQWCKDNPGAGDYDNFANVDRECKGNGSYRTCDQVKEALD